MKNESSAHAVPGENQLSAADIATLQSRAWSETYRYVFDRSPFYREHLRKAGLTLQNVPPLSEFGTIPPVDKATLSHNPGAFLCVPERKIVDIVTTSGSTGQPLIWMLTDSDLERLALNEMLSFLCAGFTPDDKVLLAVAMDRCFIAGIAYFLGLRRLGCSILRVGPATPGMHLDMLRRVKPTAVVGVPSFICMLAEKAAEAGLNPADLGLRKAACIGEPLRNSDFTMNRAGQLIESRFGARVFSTYGITELAASLCECEAGAGGHLHPSLLYIETLDENGCGVPDGQVGEVTATTFGVEGMPLVRYRTGDYAALYRGRCACGRYTPRMGPVVGRKAQKLKVKGTSLFPSTLRTVLDSTEQVLNYVIIARKAGDLSDTVEIKLACSGNPVPVCRYLAERFQGEAKVLPVLTPSDRDEIEKLQLPEGTRKRRFFIDCRQGALTNDS